MSTLQNSLTAPADKDKTKENSFKLSVNLSEDEIREAVNELSITSFVDKFPRVEKFYADPNIPSLQTYSLVSFLPATGASPDKDGVYGMLKVRGTFGTEEEASLRAEHLIRTVDSYHSIFHIYTGRPFPLTNNKKYINETLEVDLKKKVVEINSAEVRKKRDEESNIMREIEQKQTELLADVSEKKEEDPVELYTELKVKKAHLTFTYRETVKKIEEMKNSILKTRETLSKMDQDSPECKEKYMQRYMDARKKSGLPFDDKSFIMYLGEDIDLGF